MGNRHPSGQKARWDDVPTSQVNMHRAFVEGSSRECKGVVETVVEKEGRAFVLLVGSNECRTDDFARVSWTSRIRSSR